jgi:hypothetical protein
MREHNGLFGESKGIWYSCHSHHNIWSVNFGIIHVASGLGLRLTDRLGIPVLLPLRKAKQTKLGRSDELLINPLTPEYFFLISAHPVCKM